MIERAAASPGTALAVDRTAIDRTAIDPSPT